MNRSQKLAHSILNETPYFTKQQQNTLGVLLSPTFLLASNNNTTQLLPPTAGEADNAAAVTLKGIFGADAADTTAAEDNNRSLNEFEDSASDSASMDKVDDAAAEETTTMELKQQKEQQITANNTAASNGTETDLMDTNNNNAASGADGKDDLHFHSGICVIPHPNKRHKGGEDAHFISNDRKVLGVADGVGGWGDVGIDPSLYSNTLMEGAKLASNESHQSRDPIDIMDMGYRYSHDIKGSSTCCIVMLDTDNLLSANLGDSGFLVIRDSEVYFRTREQQHAFNMPFQLGTQSIDRPEHSITSAFEVEEGDIIVLGTDGVFDNLFDDEICRITMKYRSEPQLIARMVARRAYEVGNSTTIFTPFAKNAGLNGYIYSGGKLDDITVIVGIVAKGPLKPLVSDIILLDEDLLIDSETD
eukprot:gene5268-6103_t